MTETKVFLVHNHDQLPFVAEPLKGRGDIDHRKNYDMLLSALWILNPSYSGGVIDIPRDMELSQRMPFVWDTLNPVVQVAS